MTIRTVLSVSDINKYIKAILRDDFILSNVSVQGEISNFKFHSSGHMYFTLKDVTGTLKCVMFKTSSNRLDFMPENGIHVVVKGYISVYERDGTYQLYAENIQQYGIGNLYEAFEKLKNKLKNEGLFDENKKKKLPFLPKTIGVITSETGSVIKDIINVLNRRAVNYNLKLYPVHVQGEYAPREIIQGIRFFNRFKFADVIIIARGGGSFEELLPFNDENLAYEIFESQIPIISAVGHETDFTISDFVADLRAPTPSAAAEIVMPERASLENRICELNSSLLFLIKKFLDTKKFQLEIYTKSSVFRQPYDKIYQERMRLITLDTYLKRSIDLYNERVVNKFRFLYEKLDAISPLKVLERGYCIIKKPELSKVVKSIQDLEVDQKIQIYLKDGTALSNIIKLERGNLSE